MSGSDVRRQNKTTVRQNHHGSETLFKHLQTLADNAGLQGWKADLAALMGSEF